MRKKTIIKLLLELMESDVAAWNEWRINNIEEHVNFSGANLSGAMLKNANFLGVDFSGANLSKANLCETQLSYANLSNADLTDADLSNCYLSDTNFDGATLTGAHFSGSDLSHTNFKGANLHNVDFTYSFLFKANLSGSNLKGSDFSESGLGWANLQGANLSGAILIDADLSHADLSFSNLSGAFLGGANLNGANLSGADLNDADLREARIYNASLAGAKLINTNLSGAQLVKTDLHSTELTNCRIYGISVWDIKTNDDTIQRDLVITDQDEPIITVDNIKVAQFIYLLLNNPEIRDVIDTIAKKVVLILGRFTKERKPFLDLIRNELRCLDYIPVLFDFDKPDSRSFIETVSTLAHIAKFVIADVTDPRIVLQEVPHIVENIAVPVIPIQLKDSGYEPVTLYDLRRKRGWLSETFWYSEDNLASILKEKIIPTAVGLVDEIQSIKL